MSTNKISKTKTLSTNKMSKKKLKQKAEYLYEQYVKKMHDIFGHSETTFSDQLLDAGKDFFGNSFKGVFAADEIPPMRPGNCCICNLDNKDEEGSHWVGLLRLPKSIYIYDSFGRQTLQILPSLYKSGNGVIRHTERDAEQAKSEDDCGQRTMAWLFLCKKHGIEYGKWI